MKLKHIIPILITAAVTALACTQEYDDSVIKAKMDALSSQVAKLAEQVNELNTQVQGLNTVIEQWKAGGSVESIQDITGGHTITFVGGKTVTIYDGKDGSAEAPVIGVKADTDGVQYWTVDGEFLLVDGKKVPVAVVPAFSVNEAGELIVTVNGAQTNLGKVSAAGDAIFESVVADEEKVVFTLVGGKSFTIPFVKAFKLVIEKIAYSEVKAGETIAVPYTVTGSGNATVMAFAGGAYKASVNSAENKVNITVPTPASDGQVMVWAQTETVVSPIVILSFTAEAGGEEPVEVVVVSEPETYQAIPVAGGEVPVSITSNVDIVVATPTVDWVSAVLTKTAYTLTLTVKENTGSAPRSTEILISRADNGATVQKIKIAQLGIGEEPTPGESADLNCPTPPTVGNVPVDGLYGYGAGVTGGEGGTVLHFNSGKALQTWLLQRTKDEKKGTHTPTVIWLSGTFKSDEGRDFSSAHPWFDVKDVSNLSFIGTDDFVMDQIGIFCVRASNIIIRNINFQQPKANNGADAVSMQECDGVWVDHCTFTSLNQTKDYEDGSTDVTHGSKNVTVSWCRYIKTQKSCLVGHSNSQSSDTEITVTFHHNWFDNSSSRHPRVRFGQAHVYNNLYDGCTTYGAGSAYGAKVLVEYNYFDGVQLPTDICTYPAKESNESNLQGSVAGYLYPTENIYVNRPAKAKDPYPLSNVKYTKYNGSTITPLTYADFKPAYDYVVTAAADVPEVVKANAGYGKLGFTSAPIEVNNGGITEFNGTDDDPVNPDTGGGEEPVIPDTGAHTYTVSMQSKAIVQTKDGVSGASYFDASASVADFSKDYSGNFTIDGTTYSQGIKFDSKGYVKFTTSATFTTTVQFYAARRKADGTASIQLVPTGAEAIFTADTPHDTYVDSGVITLEKGTEYTIQQKSGEQALILAIVTETE